LFLNKKAPDHDSVIRAGEHAGRFVMASHAASVVEIGHSGGLFELVKADHAVKTARFSLERAECDSLNQELAGVRRVLAPPGHAALGHAQRIGGGLLGSKVLEYCFGLHGAHYRKTDVQCKHFLSRIGAIKPGTITQK
jgi:hypothetical protein